MRSRFCTAARVNRTRRASVTLTPLAFDACDDAGRPVYHTNVLMTVGTGFALLGLDWVAEADRTPLCAALQRGGRELVLLSGEQLRHFAGYALELSGLAGLLLALSRRAANGLTPLQRAQLTRHVRLLPLAVPTMERAGGSVRCMLAGVHLPPPLA